MITQQVPALIIIPKAKPIEVSWMVKTPCVPYKKSSFHSTINLSLWTSVKKERPIKRPFRCKYVLHQWKPLLPVTAWREISTIPHIFTWGLEPRSSSAFRQCCPPKGLLVVRVELTTKGQPGSPRYWGFGIMTVPYFLNHTSANTSSATPAIFLAVGCAGVEPASPHWVVLFSRWTNTLTASILKNPRLYTAITSTYGFTPAFIAGESAAG